MADKPTLADVLAHGDQYVNPLEQRDPSAWDAAMNALGSGWDQYIRPLGSAQPRGPWQWTKDHPQAAQSLAELLHYLSLLPLGRSVRGAGIGRDAVMANKLEQHMDRIGSWDKGIMGGEPNVGAWLKSDYRPGHKSYIGSSADLAYARDVGAARGFPDRVQMREGVHSAGNPIPFPFRFLGRKSAND